MCLIRKLLVLDPQQRLTASEVLDSLSSIIASWYVAEDLVSLSSSCVTAAVLSRLLPSTGHQRMHCERCNKALNPVCVKLWGLLRGVGSTNSACAVTQTALCGVTEHCWVQEGLCCCAPSSAPHLTLKSEWSGIAPMYTKPNLGSCGALHCP